MYLSHYNLTEKPFQIDTDPKFLWLGEKYREAFTVLKRGMSQGEGFVLLTGDVGTGKTTLIKALQRDLDSNVIVATIADPNLEKFEFYDFLTKAFGIKTKFTKNSDFLTEFTRFLNDVHARDKKALLIIDEAHRLSTQLLEAILMLSDIEKENSKLLNVFFVGQNEFLRTLTEKESGTFTKRVAIKHQIEPLTESEAAEYIKYRLNVAGTAEEIFTKKAIGGIYAFSHGYPRLINIICDHALLTGYARGLKTIHPAIIKECSEELTITGETTSNQLQVHTLTGKRERKPLRRLALYACMLPIIAFCAYLASREVKDDTGPRHVANDVKEQESIDDISRQQAYRADVAALQEGRAHTVVSKEKITDTNGRDSTVTVQKSRRAETEDPFLSRDVKLIIPFDYNNGKLQDEAYDTLDRLAVAMVKNLAMEIVVKGHTDTSGPPLYNKNLSELRANSVKSYLVEKGINPSRIHTIGMGDENPLEPNTTWAGRKANRRVEIELRP